MGKTNIYLEDKKINKCLKITGLKTKKEVVDYALEELIRRYNSEKLLELCGKDSIWKDFDIIKLRKNRV